MFRKTLAMLLAVVTAAGILLTGCSASDTPQVVVDSVGMITGTGYSGLNSRYSGMIVSGSTQKIEKDKDKKILELNVAVGDSVRAGEVLFSYDVQAVELALKRLELECEQLENSLKLLKENIKSCKKKVDSSKGSTKLEYEVQLQSYEIEQKEKNFELSTKQSEMTRTEEMLENADVVSKVSGIVQSINDNAGETDESGEIIPYITIIETGAYRVKCTASELDVNSIREGSRVIIRSRVDDSLWTGSIEYIEWDNPEKQQNEFYNPDSENTASRYPFYVTLDSTDGLLLGQHVYVEPDSGQAAGLMLPEYYISDVEGDAWVWAANKRDCIEKRSVELGEYDADLCCYEVLSGLTPEDYIAFPDTNVTIGAPVIRSDEMENVGEDFGEIGEGFEGEIIEDTLEEDAYSDYSDLEDELGEVDYADEILMSDGEVILG